MRITELLIDRGDLARTRLGVREATLNEGQAGFVVENFALTANNVTYAAHGVDMRYWDFYPAPAGQGIVPVWGFGRCVESRVAGLDVGTRVYGYWPFADGAVLTPAKLSPRGFVDASENRRELAKVYNGFAALVPAMADEDRYALFRPLFLTSLLLDVAFAGAGDTLLIASASSKTALGLAQLAKARGTARVVGLTSPRNRVFVEGTGYYDLVAGYDDVASLAIEGSVAFGDFAGNGALRAAVHERFAGTLTRTLVIGDTHWDTGGSTARLPGPRPEGFFAPTILQEQIATHGQAAFDARIDAAWGAFIASTASWLRVETVAGLAAARTAWTRMVGGDVDPAEGIIVRP